MCKIEKEKTSKEIAMFAFALLLILFVLVDYLLESLENLFTPEELSEMGVCLEGSLAAETR